MKSISTLAVIGMLFFACKVCSFTGNNNNRRTINVDISSPSPKKLMYARDFLKPQLGPFSLVKSYNKEEARKTATGFAAKLIDQSNDAGAAEYRSSSVKSVVLMACSYSSTATPASLVNGMERDMRASSAWRTVTNTPREGGQRIDAQDSRGNGLVIWYNGYWVFLTIGDSLSDAQSMADSVGY